MQKVLNFECIDCDSRDKGVFCSSDPTNLADLSSKKSVNVYKRGQDLFLQGNPAFGLYCINSGKVKITKLGFNGKETIVRIATAGDILGHRSLFSNSPYQASATVVEEAKICFINRNAILTLIQDDPKTSLEIMNCLSQQLGMAEEKVTSLSQNTVRERFAELLLVFTQAFGQEIEGGYRLDIFLTREEMASMVGTAAESLIRLISEFKKDGIIDQEHKRLIVKDVKSLEDIANLEI